MSENSYSSPMDHQADMDYYAEWYRNGGDHVANTDGEWRESPSDGRQAQVQVHEKSRN